MLRVVYTPEGFDFVKEPGRLATDDGLETAVILSLFTDARATDDELAEAGLVREQAPGWWGNDYPEIDGDEWGSKLYLLQRAPRTDATLVRAKDYAEQAVAWMITDGLAKRIDIAARWWGRSGLLVLDVQMYRPADLRPRWRRVWDATTGQLLEAA